MQIQFCKKQGISLIMMADPPSGIATGYGQSDSHRSIGLQLIVKYRIFRINVFDFKTDFSMQFQ